jgi:hypothetical protein
MTTVHAHAGRVSVRPYILPAWDQNFVMLDPLGIALLQSLAVFGTFQY